MPTSFTNAANQLKKQVVQQYQPPAFSKAGIVPVQRPMGPPPGALIKPVPPAFDAAGVVPVARDLSEFGGGAPAGAPAPPDPRDAAMQALIAQREQTPALPAGRQQAVKEVLANPATRQMAATVGGAVMGRQAAEQARMVAAQRAQMLAEQQAAGPPPDDQIAREQQLQQYVSQRAMPMFNQRRPGLLGR